MSERVIQCKCGCWEEMPFDQQRHHSQTFDWLRNEDDQAYYRCPECGAEVRSREEE